VKIAFDVRFKMESGSSSYIRNVIPEILRQGPGHRYALVKYPEQSFDFEDKMEDIVLDPGRSALGHMIWTFTGLPRRLKDLGVDVYHGMKFPGPPRVAAKMVLTAHSITGKYKGEFPVDLKSTLFNRYYADGMFRRADGVIAVSDFVKEFLVERERVPAERIRVIYHGINPSFQKLAEPEAAAVLKSLGVSRPYILCVGNVTPVKNHLTAVRAFAGLNGNFNGDLVIAGGESGDYADRVRAEIQRLGLTGRVKLLGFTRGQNLVGLMSGARVLLFPSLTEGCPVTALEAFRCGLPMVASKRGGLWDLGRDCALLVDEPTDHASFAEHLSAYLSDTALEKDLREKVTAKAAGFQWATAAKAHLEVYEACVTNGRITS